MFLSKISVHPHRQKQKQRNRARLASPPEAWSDSTPPEGSHGQKSLDTPMTSGYPPNCFVLAVESTVQLKKTQPHFSCRTPFLLFFVFIRYVWQVQNIRLGSIHIFCWFCRVPRFKASTWFNPTFWSSFNPFVCGHVVWLDPWFCTVQVHTLAGQMPYF